jgi:hypothetical protein
MSGAAPPGGATTTHRGSALQSSAMGTCMGMLSKTDSKYGGVLPPECLLACVPSHPQALVFIPS